MIVERTLYYAKPGHAAEVLRIRRRASAVRVALGLPAGTILVNQEGDGPDVSWECRFADEAAHQADLDARAASPEFEAVRATMRAAIDEFERQVYALDTAAGRPDWSRDIDLQQVAIAPQVMQFPAGDRLLTGFYYRPPGDGPFPLMVVNHGSGLAQGLETEIAKPSVAALLMGCGIAAFMPHRAGYGRSPGVPWRQEVPATPGTAEYDAQLSGRLDRESDDVVAALAFAQGLPGVRSARIGVMGSSFGGVVTLLAAAKQPQFRCAVEFAGAAMNWERAPGLRALMLGAVERLTRPIFFIQAANDYSVGPTEALAAAAAAHGKTVESRIWPAFGATRDEGHYFEKLGTQIWGPAVREFLEKHL